MGGVVLWARAAWRRQIGSLVALGLIAGLGIGFSLVALQGARRTDRAYDRLAEITLAPDVLGGLDDADFEAVAALPEVTAAGRIGFTMIAPDPFVPGVDAGGFVGFGDDFFTKVYRPAVIAGRLPAPRAADEVVVNEVLAERGHLEPGDTVTIVAESGDGGGQPVPVGEATVVGITRSQIDVGEATGNAFVTVPPPFFEAHQERVPQVAEPFTMLRLRPGTDLAAFERTASELLGHPSGLFDAQLEAKAINRSLRVQAFGYLALGAAALAASLLALVQGMGRQARSALAGDLPILVAMGMRPRRRLLLAAVLAAPVLLVGLLVAVAVAVIGTPLLPTGLAREVDPRTGIQVESSVLAGGALVFAVAVLSGSALVAWRIRAMTITPFRSRRSTRTSRLLQALPLRVRLGAALSLAPRTAPAGAAARSALVATTCAASVVLGAGIFAASLDRLRDPGHAELTGWQFDVYVHDFENRAPEDLEQLVVTATRDDPADEMSFTRALNMRVDEEPVEAFAFDDAGLHPSLRTGRAPQADDEIVLGHDLAQRIGVGLHDDVHIGEAETRRTLTVVGIATYPELGDSSDLGSSASLSPELAAGLVADGSAVQVAQGIALRYDDPPDVASLGPFEPGVEVIEPFFGPRIEQLDQVRAIPGQLAAFLVALGAAAVAHGLVRATRDRGRDLAILRCIGLRPRDVRAVIGFQGATTGLVGGVLGVVGGLIVGPWVWVRVADGVAAIPSIAVPGARLALLVPAAIAVGFVTALWPGWRASRRSPVVELAPRGA